MNGKTRCLCIAFTHFMPVLTRSVTFNMRSHVLLLAFTAATIGFPYQYHEMSVGIQSSPEDILVSSNLQDLHSADEDVDNWNEGTFC